MDTTVIDGLADALLKISTKETTLASVFGAQRSVLDKLIDKANGLIDHGKRLEGEALLERISLFDTADPFAAFLLASSRAKRGAHEDAVAAYQNALSCSGITARLESKVRYCRAQSYVALGDLERAIDDLRAAAFLHEDEVFQTECLVLIERFLMASNVGESR